MFVPYADAEKICEELAAYKVGDVVVFLKDIEFRGGIIKKSTKGRIVNVSLQDGVKIPTVVETDVNDYYANSDVHVFLYKVMPLGSDGKEDECGCLNCCSDIFEKEPIDDEYYRIKKEAGRAATKKYYTKSILIAIAAFVFVFCAFTLPIIPYLKSAFATCWSFEQSLFVYPFFAVIIGSPLAAFIAIAIVATDKQYARYRIGKILKRKRV